MVRYFNTDVVNWFLIQGGPLYKIFSLGILLYGRNGDKGDFLLIFGGELQLVRMGDVIRKWLRGKY
jgi:hypothetical protein